MPRLLSKQDSFNSSSATIIPERESDLRSTSTTAANALAGLDSARVLMPQDTLGRELDGWITGGENESVVESQEIDFANAVMSYTQLPLETQSTTDFTSFISRSNPDLAALVNPSMSPADILAKLHLENPNWGRAQTTPQKPSPFTHKATTAYPPTEPFRPTSAHSHYSNHSHQSHPSYSSDASSGNSVCTTEVDEDEANQLEIDLKQLHTGNKGETGALPRAKGKSGRSTPAGAPYPTPGMSTSPPMPSGAQRGGGETEEELRLKRLEHRRQINRKSAQKHRMRRREEHDNLSKDMVEKDARIAQLEKELAVEKSKTAQLQQFIDMQRGGGGGRKRSGGRTKEEDVEMDDW